MQLLKSILLSLLFSFCCCFFANAERIAPSFNPPSTNIESVQPSDSNEERSRIPVYQLRTTHVVLPTFSGYQLIRREEMVLARVEKELGGLGVFFRKNGKVQKTVANLNLCELLRQFNQFPFLKVSRSTVVNFYEIGELKGTRRNTSLVMSNGEQVKVSRSAAGDLHDLMEQMMGEGDIEY